MSAQEHITQMEMACIGAAIDSPDEHAEEVMSRLPIEQVGSKVYHLACAVEERYREGQPITPQLVLETLRQQGRMRPEYGPLVADCVALAYATPSIRHYLDALNDVYAQRGIHQLGARLQQMAGTSPLHATVAYLASEVATIQNQAAERYEDTTMTLADMLAEPPPDPVDWLIPNLLPASDRLLITAEEGLGKSTLLRQFALSYALGIDPFTPGVRIAPGRALIVDCEVSRRQLDTSLRRMYSFASRHAPDGDTTNLLIESRQGGVNLCDPTDQGWLLRLVRHHRPRLLALGPLYRMTDGDLNDEASVRCWQRIFEPLLEEGVSIVMEHHTPNAKDSSGKRDLRPIGSSVLRRWFSQGVGVRGRACDRHERDFCRQCARQARVELWRGSRDETHWPFGIRSPGSDVWWLDDPDPEDH